LNRDSDLAVDPTPAQLLEGLVKDQKLALDMVNQDLKNKNPRGREILKERMKDYYEFVEKYHGVEYKDYLHYVHSAKIDKFRVNFITLNSAYLYSPNIVTKQETCGFVGEEQIRMAVKDAGEKSRNMKTFNIAVFHYPMDEILKVEKDIVKELIQGWADVILNGHVHRGETAFAPIFQVHSSDISNSARESASAPRNTELVIISSRCVYNKEKEPGAFCGYGIIKVSFDSGYVTSFKIWELLYEKGKGNGDPGKWIEDKNHWPHEVPILVRIPTISQQFFLTSKSIADPDLLVGRNEEMRRLCNFINSDEQLCIMTGPRRYGKSSVAYSLLKVLVDKDHKGFPVGDQIQFIPLYVSLDGVRSLQQLTEKLEISFQKTKAKLNIMGGLDYSQNFENSLKELQASRMPFFKFMGKLSNTLSPDEKLVIVLDEVQHIKDFQNEKGISEVSLFFENIKDIEDNYPNFKIIMTGTVKGTGILRKIRYGDPLHGRIRPESEIRLKTLSQTDSETFLKRAFNEPSTFSEQSIRFNKKVVDIAVEGTYGVSGYLAKFAQIYVDRLMANPTADIEDVAREILEKLDKEIKETIGQELHEIRGEGEKYSLVVDYLQKTKKEVVTSSELLALGLSRDDLNEIMCELEEGGFLTSDSDEESWSVTSEFGQALETPRYFYEKAGKLFEHNDFERAIVFYTKAITKDPEYINAYFNRGLSYVMRNMYKEAKLDIAKVLEVEPDKADVPSVMGAIAEYEHDTKAAVEWYLKSLLLNPRYEPPRQKLIDLVLKVAKDTESEETQLLLQKVYGTLTQKETYWIKGKIQENKNDFMGAIECYGKSLEIDPNYQRAKESIRELGENLALEGNKIAAEPVLQRIVDITPINAYLMGLLLEKEGNFRGAAEWCEKSLEVESHYEPAKRSFRKLALALAEQDGVEVSEPILQREIKLYSKDYLYIKGIILERKCDINGAAESFEKCLALDPGDIEATLRLERVKVKKILYEAQRLVDEGHFLEAISKYNEAFDTERKERRPYLRMFYKNYSSFVDKYFGTYAYPILGSDYFSEAKKNITHIIELQPRNTDAMWLMGIISEYENNLLGEAKWYGKILDLDPNSEKSKQKLDEILDDLVYQLFKPEGLEKIEPTLLKIANDYSKFNPYIYGAISERKGDLRGAIDWYVNSLEGSPDFIKPKVRIRTILEHLVEESIEPAGLEEIEQILQKVIEFNFPENNDYINGVILERKGELKGAAELYLKALDHNSNYEPARKKAKGIAALLFRSNGNLEEAKAFCERLVKINPKDAAESYNILVCESEIGYSEDGIAILSRVIELDNTESLYFNNRAYFLARVNIARNFEKAELDAREAIKLDSSSQTAWTTYAEIFALSAQKDKGLTTLENALKSGKINLEDLLNEVNKDLNKPYVSDIEKEMLQEFVAKHQLIASRSTS
jgi:tetratricopeptide (TPR) repeat protein